MKTPPLRFLGAFLCCSLTPAAYAAPLFSDCFTLKPNVTWETERSTVTAAEIDYHGQPAIQVDTLSDGMRASLIYDRSGRKILGAIEWGVAAFGGNPDVPDKTLRWTTSPTYPAQISAGERFTLTGKGVQTTRDPADEQNIDYPGYPDYLFVGFEDLTINIDGVDRTFHNVCHIRAEEEGKKMESWFAPKLGQIRLKFYQDNQLIMAEEITRIVQE